MTRRELLAALGTAPLLRASPSLPTAPVAVRKCQNYSEDLYAIMREMAESLGGLAPIVRNRTVTVKLNLTGSPALRMQGRPLGLTHYTHPKTASVLAQLLKEAGARRIRFVESCWGTGGPMDEYLLESGWNVRQLKAIDPAIELINTNALGTARKYVRFKVPGGGLIYPAWDLHPIYDETDVMVSMAKLKNHASCGITLAMKNIFGITPASIYGDDAGTDEPNESPEKGRGDVCHFGKRQPAKSAPAELDLTTPRNAEYRMPRVTAELNAARPFGISFIDGIETIAGGEGPWIQNVRHVRPGLLILGTNTVTTDAVGTALMGYNPRAPRGVKPFENCDNTLLLAEQLGLGTADLNNIEVRGATIKDSQVNFG